MLAKRLKNNITCFSIGLNKINEKGEVVIGGKITEIIDMTEIISGFTDEEKVQVPVFVNLDDSIGTINVVLLREVYNKYREKIKKGSIVIIEGLTFHINTHEGKETRVYGFKISKLPTKKPKEKEIDQ